MKILIVNICYINENIDYILKLCIITEKIDIVN